MDSSRPGSRQRAFWILSPGDFPGASALILPGWPRWPQEAGQPQSHWGRADLKVKAVREPGGWTTATPRRSPRLALRRSHGLLLPQVRKSIFGRKEEREQGSPQEPDVIGFFFFKLFFICSNMLSIARKNTITKNNLERIEFILLTLSHQSLLSHSLDKTGTKVRQEPRGRNPSTDHRRMLLPRLVLRLDSTSFVVHPGSTAQGCHCPQWAGPSHIHH